MSHAVRTHFIAPKHLINEVDALVGPRHRTEFLVEAAQEKLKREKLLRSTREMLNLPPTEVPEWATPSVADKWLRDLRTESDRHRGV